MVIDGALTWTAALTVLLSQAATRPESVAASGVKHGSGGLTRIAASSPLFARPTYVAVDFHGDIYVADSGNARVEKLSPAGRLVYGWVRETRRAHLFSPLGIALDGKGNVYVVDATRRLIDKLSPEGGVLSVWRIPAGNLNVSSPGSIAIDRHGIMYVVDQTADQVIKLSPRGQILARWGRKGSGRGRFLNPHGIAVDRDGNIYVADYSNLRIVKLSSTGKVLAFIGAGRFDEDEGPQGVAVDTRGDIYVGAGGVVKFSPGGRLLGEWKRYGPDHRSLAGAFGVAIDRRSNIYVIDQSNRALVKLSSSGRTLAAWK